VALYGRGEAAELAYLSLKESGLDPVAVFDKEDGPEFLGLPVLSIGSHERFEFDLVIVATLDRSGQQAAEVLAAGVPRDKLYPLRQEPDSTESVRKAKSASSRSKNGTHSHGS
jgi:hypothetical protein